MAVSGGEAADGGASEPARPAQPPKELPCEARAAVATFFRHASPRILLAALAIAVGWRLALGGWRGLDFGVALALILWWPLNEWLIHVFMLHHRPRRLGRFTLDYLVARKHRQHHADPWNLPLVFIPLHVYPLALPAIVLTFLGLAPDARIALTALSVYALLSLHYEWSHYLAHIGWHPPLAHYARRVREHRLHHFRNEHYWWGVSMGSADRWLGTAPDAEAVARSPTTATLGVR